MKTFCLTLAAVVLGGLALMYSAPQRAHGKGPPADLQLNGDAKAQFIAILALYRDQIKELQAQSPPIGTILPFAGDVKSLPGNWQLCDGAPLRDITSPLRTVLKDARVPNLHGKFLRGAVSPGEFLAEGGAERRDVKVQLGVNLKVGYRNPQNNVLLHGPKGDPRTYEAFVTGSAVIWGHNGDFSPAGVGGLTDQRTFPVETLPPYANTYYIIRIK